MTGVFWILLPFLLICSFTAFVTAQTCQSQMTCRDCIRTAGCVWLSDINYVGLRCQNGPSIPGCNPLQNLTIGCIGETTPSDTSSNPVSIQNINLNLRVGEPLTFTVNVTTLRNLPLDLYILMDLSNSMRDELATVKSIAEQIANRISAITTNVRLGFGSFNDKVTRPFTYDTCDPNMRREDCSLYAFRHQVDLTSDITAFNNSIQAVDVTGNADCPENGLEALAQVVSCENIIGWRSRDATGIDRGLTRIVLFLTDEQFHYSGEGRLAGILRPYDGQCYLMRDENTSLPINYLRWDEFDYPSVGQIISLLSQFEVVTVFAVAQDVLPTYQNLQDLVDQQYSARTTILTSNAPELLDLIQSVIVEDVRLLPVATVNTDLDFSIQATCPQGATQPSVDMCAGVPLDSVVTFNVTVTLTSCDAFRNRTIPKQARVNVPGFGNFNITYTGVCGCDCEQNMTTRPHPQHANLNNLDIQEPIVRRSPADDADFFGWATVLHQLQTVGDADDLDTAAESTRIIVGAPMGTFPGGLPLPDPGQSAENQTGLVYSCPVQPGVCEGVRGDMSIYAGNPDGASAVRDLPDNGPVIEGRLFDQAPNALVVNPDAGIEAQFEIKTGQLMGATLYSTGENFVACAPRWTATVFTSAEELPRGACYASGRQLTNFQFLQPCFGGPASTFNTDGVGYCMAGVSVTRVGNCYAVAAPGYDGLRGRVYYGANNTAIRSGGGELHQPDSSGNLVEINNQYQGFQTTTGFITQRQDPDNNGQVPDHIATAPRYNGTTYRGRVNIVNQLRGLTGPYLDITAEGQQMGEFFGYSIAAADLNGDGFDELVIGAPMYTDIRRAAVDIGRVYVFNNTGGDLSQTSVVLEGQVERGRFGTSVVNLGDIDDDSYEDIAVGAPYADNGNNNQGAVYIYYGRADIAEFAQQTPFEIRAEQIVDVVEGLNELRTFGWSLSSGVDVDNNQYNDLSIGAYESKTVVLLRTLPVANVNVSFDPVPPVDLNAMSCDLGPCFNVTIRATYTGIGLSGPIDYDYIIRENHAANVQNSIVFDAQNSTLVKRTLRFRDSGVEITDIVAVYARSNIIDTVTLQIEVQNINRGTPRGFNGNQTLTDLSRFPRLRQTGLCTTTLTTLPGQLLQQVADNLTLCNKALEGTTQYVCSTTITGVIQSIGEIEVNSENAQEVVNDLTMSVELADEDDQTPINFAVITEVIVNTSAVVALAQTGGTAAIPLQQQVNITRDVVQIIDSVSMWPVSVTSSTSSRIIEAFEVIVASVIQEENFDELLTEGNDVALLAERVDQENLGRTFGANDVSVSVGEGTTTTLPEDQDAAISLPPSLFAELDLLNTTEVGIGFTFYETAALFPLPEGSPSNLTVGSSVVGALVGGQSFSDLQGPVTIFLQLTSQDLNPQCASWNFSAAGGRGDWTTDGCELTGIDDNVVTCQCNHLTNFAVLVDICTRTEDCRELTPATQLGLTVISIVGALLSLFGLTVTVITILTVKKLRKRDVSKFHIQLCIALFCMLLVFVSGINQTQTYGGCVTVSALIHYFTLVTWMWMGAEAMLMFQKLVIVFFHITTRYIIAVSFICWLLPIVPVVIPMAIDRDFMVTFTSLTLNSTISSADISNTTNIRYCFISDRGVFFGAFLGPIFAILLFNTIIFVIVMSVLAKQIHKKFAGKDHLNRKTVVRLTISTMGLMALFGLTWAFGALTVREASPAFQYLFAIFNSLQGFFIFLFFCVFGKEGREFWLKVLCCGRKTSGFTPKAQPKYSAPGKSLKPDSINTGLKSGPTTSIPNLAFQSCSIGKQFNENETFQDMSMMEVNPTTLKLEVVKESHTNQFPDNPSAEKVSNLSYSLDKKQEVTTEAPDHSAPVLVEEQIDGTPWSPRIQ